MTRPGGPLAALRPRRHDDEGVGMLQVVLVLLMTAAMSVAVLATVVGEVLPTAAERARERTLHAAGAGLEAGLAVVRAARTTVAGTGEVGDLTRLPCATAANPLRGSAGATVSADGASPTSYAVVIRYYLDDPSGHPESWRATNTISCVTGGGTPQAPYYALLQSVATASSEGGLPAGWTDRSVEVVYAFNRTDAGIAGGLVKVGTYSASADLCWASPSTAPATGSVPVLATCDAARDEQLWSFRDDYSVVLAGTQSAVSGTYDGMCLTGEPRDRADLTDHGTSPADATASSSTAVTPDLTGPVEGSAHAFSGASSWLRTSTSFAPPAAVTVAAWFRTTARSGTVIGFGGDPGTAGTTADRMLWVDSAGHLVWGVSPTSRRTVTSTGTYADGAWHHVAASVGWGGTKLYVDGALVAWDPLWTSAGSTAGYWHVGWGGELVAGWVQAPSNPYWQGSLAHVSVWPRQLWDWEVTSVATAPTWQDVTGLAASTGAEHHWPLGGAVDDVVAFLAPCDGGPHQKWAYNDGGRIELERFDATALSGACVDAPTLAAGAGLTLQADCGAARDWAPSSAVGAGAAGDVTGQLVNYGEFGRCLDVTNQKVTWPYLIAFPCKADPTRPVLWNQRFVHDPVTGLVTTPAPTGDHCLRTPTSTGGYVLTVPCDAADTAQHWVKLGATGARATAYTITDVQGRCLSLGRPGETSGGLAQWSTITADVCDGSRVQKWNAPPQLAGAGVQGYRETTLDGSGG
ncbi:LamG-like jellyroll fold domain-containing protein [Kineosporia sp. R_H_3]|uniref:LamG-like jellyroll fold domain-containing protein n=1 Tax=Kineosporia sp. R_H_3 TaxID=1961848 RepID=UPI000B4C0100|nr:LamG-like jellyroll fold domain-containing protein [Kineosporia sp. R_H_3]